MRVRFHDDFLVFLTVSFCLMQVDQIRPWPSEPTVTEKKHFSDAISPRTMQECGGRESKPALALSLQKLLFSFLHMCGK